MKSAMITLKGQVVRSLAITTKLGDRDDTSRAFSGVEILVENKGKWPTLSRGGILSTMIRSYGRAWSHLIWSKAGEDLDLGAFVK